MDKMTVFLCCALTMLPVGAVDLTAGPAQASEALIDRWDRHIADASRRFRIPEAWIRAVIKTESGGRTMRKGRPITSSVGAIGLMQLMPGTYEEMRFAHVLGHDPHQPRDNIMAGTAYLRAMLDRFGYPGLFAAYNAGPARYEEHLRTGKPLPAETRAYIEKLAGSRALSRLPLDTRSGTRLFLALRGSAIARPDDENNPAKVLFSCR